MESEIDLYTTDEEDSDMTKENFKKKSGQNSNNKELQKDFKEEQDSEQERKLQQDRNWCDSDTEIE